jgi:hypothetical protein
MTKAELIKALTDTLGMSLEETDHGWRSDLRVISPTGVTLLTIGVSAGSDGRWYVGSVGGVLDGLDWPAIGRD